MRYLILSTGEYSDYRPTWYAGEKHIREDEFKQKGVEIGDKITSWFYSLPEKGLDRIKPDGTEINQYELSDLWIAEMVAWLKSEGYEPIEASGEINVAYSEIPTSKTWGV